MRPYRPILAAFWTTTLVLSAYAQIPTPQDAPLPLSAAESALRFAVPQGFRVELIACEPLVREPSGVCWDADGQLFVCELHGYNLEGQYDIVELNKSGQLDRVVRRIQADERHKRAAEAETYGTIKRLFDTDGDGQMDRADVWADRLPPCLGICPANGGLIAACQTQILFLADRDDNGVAEVREVLFDGFAKGPLERSINAPQWGPDHWIYFGNGAGGGVIHGPSLPQPVELPRTDFRIRADGSAIEPVVGSTGTMGFTFADSGDRFVISTGSPGIFVAPIAWHYLARNPDVATPRLERRATSDQRSWPTSEPHPWRTRRANDPGFAKYYTDRYGDQESAPNGYFTSACSPLVYRDTTLPGLRGQLLACEPAQNFVHRAIVQRDGAAFILQRPHNEQQSEFLTSTDRWFHAISLSHAPDGRVFLVDFYREIIEDYSAIPRYLQQEYGLVGGQQHGRIWCLSHDVFSDRHDTTPSAMSAFRAEQLAENVASVHCWRRETARRLLIERQASEVVSDLDQRLNPETEPYVLLNVMYTLDGLHALSVKHVQFALQHPDWTVRRQGLRFAERWLKGHGVDDSVAIDPMLQQVIALASDVDPAVRLQAALTLGETTDARARAALTQLARTRTNELWMPLAILTSISGRGGALLSDLLSSPDSLGEAKELLEPLCQSIGSRRDSDEISGALVTINALHDTTLQARCLSGLESAFRDPVDLPLSNDARAAVQILAENRLAAVQKPALALIRLLNLESPGERQARLATAIATLADVQMSVATQLTAVQHLADDGDPDITRALLAAVTRSTPTVREAILQALLGRQERYPAILDAIESMVVPASLLSAVQRASLLDAKDATIRVRAANQLLIDSELEDESFEPYRNALTQQRDAVHGGQVFREKCGTCHQAHGIGHAVGPDLSAEFQRAEETILRDVLAPNEMISAGYVTYSVVTHGGQVISGLLALESPTSITLRQAEGKEHIVLRKEIDELRTMSVSLMPDDLEKTVPPQALADLLSWLRQPPTSLMLLDENRDLVTQLNEGSGSAEFLFGGSYHGNLCLQITPPQRYSPRIVGWQYPIRERPVPGEFRYLRFAWKAADAKGAMMELAADGRWPPSDQAVRRYHAGQNTTGWQSVQVADGAPTEWTVVTCDLWHDFGEFTLTGFAPTAIGGAVLFDHMELLQSLPGPSP